MKHKDWDQYIHDVLEDRLSRTPPPPLTKEETWENIISGIYGQQAQQKKSTSKQYWYASAIAVTLILLVVSLFPFKNVSASGWLSRIFVQTYGTVTNLVQSIGTPSSLEDKKSFPPEMTAHEVTQEKMTLSNAQNATKFKIMIPEYMPSGYALQDVSVLMGSDHFSDEVTLNYKSGVDYLYITELAINEQLQSSSGSDNDDTRIKSVTVNGQEGTLLVFKDGSKQLMWNAASVHLVIRGKLSEEAILNIAQSMK